MASSSTITLGLRSSEGRQRLQISASATGVTLKAEIRKLLNLDQDFKVKKDKNGRPAGPDLTLTRMPHNLANGDVLYITPLAGTRFVTSDDNEEMNDNSSMKRASSSSSLASSKSISSAMSSAAKSAVANLIEDPVDVQLSKLDGRIKQPKTANCQCKGSRSGCIYCTPKDPFDPEYLKKEGIKFLSFHSYLRKLQSDKGKYAVIEDINLKIKSGCTSCWPGWPESICSACQPPALTLNRQTYRHVDNIMFENADIVDNFLTFWRTTGAQRMGYLYGRYEQFPEVPLGIKAVVCAIYEPPQEGSRDGIKLHPEEPETEATLHALADNLGLTRIGWIFTDLVSDSTGNVKHFRNIDTHFLSSQECITAGHYQNLHPNVTKMSSTGKHGSKFVTVVVTGSADRQVHMEGYQVSNQCMALVREQVLLPTKDAPELGFVRESSSKQYVPDVFYKLKDEYGNEVTKAARPLPVEYLLIDVPVATPFEPIQSFNSKGFPTENRPMEGHLQDFSALANHRKNFDHKHLPDFFKDFHLLIYLATQTVHPLDRMTMAPLLRAIRDLKMEEIYQWVETSHWHTLEALIQNYNDGYQ